MSAQAVEELLIKGQTRSGTWGRCSQNTHASQLYLQTTDELFLMFWANIRWLGILSSSDEVYDDSISLNYILLSVNCNLGWEMGHNWAKIERNDGKQLCIQTSLVDWSICTWAQWSIEQHARIVWASLISSIAVGRYDCLPHRSP